MSNQIVLNALKSQIESLELKAKTMHTEVVIPAKEKLVAEITDWLRTECDLIYVPLKVEMSNSSAINISVNMESKSRWTRQVELRKERNWRTGGENEEYCNLRFDGESSIQVGYNAELTYMKLVGEVGKNFSAIANEFLNNWSHAYDATESEIAPIWEEIQTLNRSVRQVESDMAVQKRAEYRKIGVKFTLKPYREISWQGDERILEEKPGTAQLQYGRGNYEYTFVNSYKIIGKVGIKYRVEVEGGPKSLRTYEITAMRLDQFIEEVLEWETKTADWKTKRAEQYYAEYTKNQNA